MKAVLSLFVLSAVVFGGAAAQAKAKCLGEAEAAMKKYGVKDAHLFAFDPRGKDNSMSYLLWFETKKCGNTGYVNVVMNENCYVNDVFTRYQCEIPGLKRWW